MLSKLSPETKAVVEPFVNRYETFEGKVAGRAAEVEQEAGEGLDELIQMNPLDPNAISAGFNAVKNRFDGLGTKVEQAMEKLEEEWEEATGDLDLEGEELSALYGTWYGMVNKSRLFMNRLEHWHEKVEAKKNADWARILYKLAEEECQKPRACPSCGAPIDIDIKHAHSAIRCPHCDSVNEMDIGMATGLYYQGNGVHSLAHEKVLDKWMGIHDAEYRFNEFRHPTNEDRARHLDAARTYWTAYYQEFQKLHPGFKQTIEEAVAGRMGFYDQYDNPDDQQQRAYYSQLLGLVASGDLGAVRDHMEGFDDRDEVPSAVLEHGDREGTVLTLQALYELDDEDEDRDEWIMEKLKDLDEELANR